MSNPRAGFSAVAAAKHDRRLEMSGPNNTDQRGLPWPEAYQELRPPLQEKWGVEEDIYLHHQLSGKSGAAVYAADIHSSDFSGQAMLKLVGHPTRNGKRKQRPSVTRKHCP